MGFKNLKKDIKMATKLYQGQSWMTASSGSTWNDNNTYLGGGYIGGGYIDYKPLTPPAPDMQLTLRIAQLEKELTEARKIVEEAQERIRELEKEVEEKVIVI